MLMRLTNLYILTLYIIGDWFKLLLFIIIIVLSLVYEILMRLFPLEYSIYIFLYCVNLLDSSTDVSSYRKFQHPSVFELTQRFTLFIVVFLNIVSFSC